MILPYTTYTIRFYSLISLILIFFPTADNANRIIPVNQYSFDSYGIIYTTTGTSNYCDAVIDNVYVNKSIKYNKHASRDKPSQSTTIFLSSIACASSTSNTSFKISISKPLHVRLYHKTCSKSNSDFDLLPSLYLHIKTVVFLI